MNTALQISQDAHLRRLFRTLSLMFGKPPLFNQHSDVLPSQLVYTQPAHALSKFDTSVENTPLYFDQHCLFNSLNTLQNIASI